VLTMDLHAPQLQGFFDIPLDHLLGGNILANYFLEKFGDMAQRLDVPLAIIDKRRPKANV